MKTRGPGPGISDAKVLEAIANYIVTNGYSPSFREVGDLVGLASTASVRHHIERLQREGHLAYDSRRPRTLRLTNQAAS